MGTEEDEDDPRVNLFGLDDPTAAATPREWTPCDHLPIAANQYAAMPSAIAGMGTEEDEDDPLVALVESDRTAATMLREQTHRPIAATQYAATASAIAGMGKEEDEDDPLVALVMLTLTPATTLRVWAEHVRPPKVA